MRKKLLSIIIVFSLILSSNISFASHIAGADLTYTCLGGNTYLIHFAFYRDCSGISEPSSVSINFKSVSCGQNFNATLYKISGTGGEVTPACPSQPTTCSGGSIYGLREWIYEAQVTLPPCSDWVMSYSLCCRNPPINTISGPSNASIWISANLNNLDAPCNSSPSFSNPPVTIICQGQTFCFNHGAIDPDGDSLVYSLVTPYDNGPSGSPVYVSYIGGLNATQPLPSNPPVTIDHNTGDICMTPTQNVITVMAVLVEEWRTINGVPVKIGSVYRDIQVNVITCTNTLPVLGGLNPQSTQYNPNDTVYQTALCLGNTISFGIYPYDPNSNQNLNLSWNNGIPTGTFNVTNNNTPNAYGYFSWTPSQNDVSNVPHCFTATITDDACPYFGTQTYSYCITVKGMWVDLGPDTLLCKGETYTISALADTSAVNYAWTINGILSPIQDTFISVNSNILPAGDYIIEVTVDDGSTMICPGYDQVKVKIVDLPVVNLIQDTSLCDGQNITLNAGSGTLYLWNTGETTQTITVTQTGTYSVIVDGGNGTRCNASDSVNLLFVPQPVVDLGNDTCAETAFIIDAGNPGMYYLWSTGATTQTINVNTSDIYSVTVNPLPGNNQCDVSDSKNVQIIPKPVINLKDTTICKHQHLTINGAAQPGNGYTYSWSPLGLTTPTVTITDQQPGDHQITVSVTGCTTVTDMMLLKVEPCDLTIPNVITPNNDGLNDQFKIVNLEYYPNSSIVIFNRWGKKIYESSNYQNDWDGEGHSDGVYYYILNINYGSGSSGDEILKEVHGTVTILGKK